MGHSSWVALSFFFAFVGVTLALTYWAAKKTKTAKEFYAAGRSITGFQNGLALAGDYMSAASFLGIAGMVATKGYDGLIYSVGFLVGWPICMFLVAEPLRNLGKFTFADVVAYRLRPGPIRTAAASSDILKPGKSKPADVLSLGLALMFGTAGLPHILMRFYTVPDAKAARKSVFYATGWIGYFYVLTFLIGFGAAVLVGREAIAKQGGTNMAAPLLALHLGGNAFFGFLSAVAFATILAVVAGLALAGASALSHDLYVGVIKKGVATEREQVIVARVGTIVLGALAVVLGIVFKGQNVAFVVGLAFAVAASANFPALLLSVVWKRYSTWGAVASIVTGLVLAIGLIVVGPDVWVGVFKKSAAIFPLKNPAIVSITASFVVGIIVSLFTPDPVAP